MDDIRNEAARELDRRRGPLGDAVMARQYALQPELLQRYDERQVALARQDVDYLFSYLLESIAADCPALFRDFVTWAKVFLPRVGVPVADLALNLECLRDVLHDELPPTYAGLSTAVIEAGLSSLPELPSELPSHLRDGAPLVDMARAYLEALLQGDRHTASRIVLDAFEAGAPVPDLYEHVFQPSQREIGRLWQTSRISVAQEHFCTAATQLVMSQLYPHVFSTERTGRTMVATCVGGDLHEIGIRMVSDLFEIEGWETYFLGASTPTPSILRTLAEREADLLAVSSTMVFHLGSVRELVRAVRAEESLNDVVVMVGGYPFNLSNSIWQSVGADLYAPDARTAVRAANERLPIS